MKLSITASGIELITSCLANGGSLIFTSMKIGNGTNEDLNNIETNFLNTIGITTMEHAADTQFVTLSGVLNNSDVEEGYRATELGVMAKEGEDGEEVLFAYGCVKRDQATYIPASEDHAFELRESVMVYVGAVADVSSVIAATSEYTTKIEFNEHKAAKNPHGVTKDDVGLGNVPNVTTDNQTPTVEFEDLGYIGDHADIDDMFHTIDEIETCDLDPQNGDNMKVLMKKLCTVAKICLRHIKNTENPHDVTYTDTDGASSTHQHSAQDIIKGTLPISRGGTGYDSPTTLYYDYANRFCPKIGYFVGDGYTDSEAYMWYDKRPIAIFFWPNRPPLAATQVWGGFVTPDTPLTNGDGDIAAYLENESVVINENEHEKWTFRVNYDEIDRIYTNTRGVKYTYIAWFNAKMD